MKHHNNSNQEASSIDEEVGEDEGADLNEIVISSNKFSVDYAKRGTAKYRKCQKAIGKDLLRIGKYTTFKEKIITQYLHPNCAFSMFDNARLPENTIQDTSEIDAMKNISEKDLAHFIEEIKKLSEKRLTTGSETARKTYTTRKQVTAAARRKKLVTRTEPAIKIVYANADQLTTGKKDELIARIEKEKPMIVAMTEVKPKNLAKERALIDYEIENYTLHPVNLLNTDPGRGIAVYTHKSLEKSIAEITSDVKFEECCLIEIRLRGGDTMLFACCYRSPTQGSLSNENNEKLNQLLRVIARKKYSHRCIVGDFNYKDINWTSWMTGHAEESEDQKFIDTIRDCFFFQHVQQFTRNRGNDQPSTLDLVFTDRKCKYLK